MRRRLPMYTAAVLAAPLLALAQGTSTVYRCGPDGKQYSTEPCPGGRTVPAADERSDEQRRQAEDATAREKRLADQLRAEREQREKSIKPAAAGHIGPTAAAASAPKKPVGGKKKPRSKPKKKATAA